MKFRGVIFDLDGTLINSIDDLADSMNSILRKHNFPIHDRFTYEGFIGHGIKNLVKKSLPESYRDEQKCLKYFYMMMDEYSKNCTKKSKPYNGISELLHRLISNNIKIAVLSNKADNLTKKTVLTLLPDWDFEFIVGFTTEENRKPNPLVALQISKGMGIDPCDIAFVGDSGIDMQTANNAGMYSVGVLWGFRSEEELVSNGAKHLISHPLELMEFYSL